jgi:DNA-binding response OmpR family regulator
LIAHRKAAQDWAPYHLGIFFHAASRLAHTPLDSNMTDSELARLGHLLMSMAMIAKVISQEQSSLVRSPELDEAGVRLDEENYEAWVDGARIRLTEQEFKLLSFLHSRANQLCALREIVEQVLEYRYDEGQEANVHTAINRLRKKIEPYPHSPRYIHNERGRGYRLILNPPAKPKR